MQNLSQKELNQIAEMRDQSRDELDRLAKIGRIKNYEEMSKEELIISLLKSKQSIAELFNGKVSKKDYYKPILIKSYFKGHYKYYERRGERKKFSVRQYLNKISQHLYDLVSDHRIARKVWKIQLFMCVNFISPKDTGETHTIYVWSDNVKIMWDSNTDDIIRKLFKSFSNNYKRS